MRSPIHTERERDGKGKKEMCIYRERYKGAFKEAKKVVYDVKR